MGFPCKAIPASIRQSRLHTPQRIEFTPSVQTKLSQTGKPAQSIQSQERATRATGNLPEQTVGWVKNKHLKELIGFFDGLERKFRLTSLVFTQTYTVHVFASLQVSGSVVLQARELLLLLQLMLLLFRVGLGVLFVSRGLVF